MKKKHDEYLGLKQKVQQIVGLRKISMTNTWNKSTIKSWMQEKCTTNT